MAVDVYGNDDGTGDPADAAPPPPGITREDVIRIYQQYLHRAPESEAIIQQQMQYPGGLDALENGVRNSPEAVNLAHNPTPASPAAPPAGTTPPTRPTGGSLSDPEYVKKLIAWAATQPNANPSVKNDPNYWIGAVGRFNNDENYFVQRMLTPEGQGEGNNLGDFAKGGLLDPFTETFNDPGASWDMPDLPQFKFDYKDFAAPDPSKIYDDPSYKFRKAEGEQSLGNNAAAQGLARSGGTLKDFIKYGQNFASNEYANIYNRDLSTWGVNEKKAFDTATTDYGGKLTGYTTTAASRQRQAETDWQHAWQQYMGKFDIYKSNHSFPADVLLRSADIGSRHA